MANRLGRSSHKEGVMGELKKIEKEEKVIEKEEKFLENRQTVIAALEQIGIMRWRSYYLLTAGAVLLMALTFGLGIVAVNNNVEKLQSTVDMLNNKVSLQQIGGGATQTGGALGLPLMQYIAPQGCSATACDTSTVQSLAKKYGFSFDRYDSTYIQSPVLLLITKDKKLALADPTSEADITKAVCSLTNDAATCALAEELGKVMVSYEAFNPVKGNANAPVTIVEFSEFLCPYCKRFADDQMKQIVTNYVDTGKVKIVFRHYIIHGDTAEKIAEASLCANDQGKFWEMHDALFANQANLTSVDVAKRLAAGLGLDITKFNNCVDSGQHKADVQKDITDGQKFGVSGTPSFFISGVPIVGAQPYATFKAAIDAALASA